ncbi:unnamed protein product [Anisakis simplex]|uniref:Protein PBDC1 (inferred by orthology to a human protein) n=1 Tax=Anisakis simplex TaxID=6269 RepID=A0A0M3KDZ0_ANISI|nr:unnamed protein product [Anisakis simplex]
MSFHESDFTSLASRDIAAQLSGDAQQYVNDPSCEVAWACKAAERASIHMNLLLGCNTDMNVESITEKELKGENKEKWFTFCDKFKDSVEEYNLGTILRMRADGAYSEANTIIVPKIIFLAIEAARNKEGVNERAKEAYRSEHERVNREGGNIC